MSEFSLLLLTPREVVYEGEVTSLVLPTADGAMGFLSKRERITVEVLPGDVKFTSSEGEVVLETDGGVAEMQNNVLTLLCGVAYRKEEAAGKRSERASRLEEERKKQEQSLAEYKINRATLIRAFDKLRRKNAK